MTDFKMISLKDIHPDPNQPRRIYDETAMHELTASVREKGILQPILLRPNGKGFILVCGERRFRAAGSAGLNEIPAVIRVLTDEEALELQIIENLQRKDVHPMEEAVAFKSLLDKGKQVQDIANRVGKKIYYVNQRLKLNQLTKEWQSVYFGNHIGVSDAMRIAVMPEKQQRDFYMEHDMPRKIDRKEHVSFSDWNFNKYRGNLSTATFDLTDLTLNSKMGACTNCKYNSGAMALFAEAAKNPVCTNITCFVHKTNFAFDRKLKAAKDDPSMVLISTSYYVDEGERKKFEKGGQKLYGSNEYEAVRLPEKPDWIEFCEEEEDMSDVQKQKEFDKLMKQYNEELEAYNKKVEGGKYLKALVVSGNRGEAGQVLHIKLNPKKSTGSSKATAEKVKEGKLTAEDISEEIKRIQDREKRNRQLDINKIHGEIEAQAKKNKSKILALDHKPIDRAIMIWILLTEVGYNPDWRNETMGYAFDKLKELAKWSDKQLSHLIRKIVFDRMVHGGTDIEVRHKHTAIRLIAEYAGIDIKKIESAQKEIAGVRVERVNKRIADLQKKKKELTSESKPAKKKPKSK